MADVEKPRDPVAAWEFHVGCQFKALETWARQNGCLLKITDLPKINFGPSGKEHEVFHDTRGDRFWKTTFPGQSGVGPTGFFTPVGYLRRLRLSNLIFGDDVRFEGVLARKAGLSLVTSQHYVHPHPDRFVPTKSEIARCLQELGFTRVTDTSWEREDGLEIGDVHDRNLIRTPDDRVEVIDVQPVLKPGATWENVRPFGGASPR